jgi:hypothetical protein
LEASGVGAELAPGVVLRWTRAALRWTAAALRWPSVLTVEIRGLKSAVFWLYSVAFFSASLAGVWRLRNIIFWEGFSGEYRIRGH